MHHNGLGVKQDHKEAIKWSYNLLENREMSRHKSNLGRMSCKRKRSFKRFQGSSQVVSTCRRTGKCRGTNQFGTDVMQTEEECITINHKEAVKWYRLAGEQGNAEAQINLDLLLKEIGKY